MKKIITGIVIVAAFLIGMAIFLTQRESAFSAHWHDQVSQRIQRLDDYSLHAAHYDRWFDARHDDLFSANYSTFSGFDGEAYLAKIFNTTADLAFLRDVRYPLALQGIRRAEITMQNYGERSPENAASVEGDAALGRH